MSTGLRSVSSWKDPFGTVQADVALLGRSVQMAGGLLASVAGALAAGPGDGSCASAALDIRSSVLVRREGRDTCTLRADCGGSVDCPPD